MLTNSQNLSKLHEILGEFEIQTHRSIPTRRLNPVLINKKKNLAILFVLPSQPTTMWKWKKVKWQKKKLNLASDLKQLNVLGEVISIITVDLGRVVKDLEKKLKTEDEKNSNLLDHTTVEISSND